MTQLPSEAAILASSRRRITVRDAHNALSPYDFDRKAIPLVEDKTMSTIQMRAFNKDLQCPVCWGIIRDTRAVMVCMHRFCRECIERSLQLGKRECPQCRAAVPSRRSLRPDPNFDLLISKIYPDLDDLEEKQVKMATEITQMVDMHKMAGDSVAAGMERQAQARSTRISRKDLGLPDIPRYKPRRSDSDYVSNKQRRLENDWATTNHPSVEMERTVIAPQDVWFNLVKDDQSPGHEGKELPYEKSYLKTCGYTRIVDVIEYLAEQIGVEQQLIEIIVDVDGLLIPMSRSISLLALIQNYWTRRQDLVLKFRIHEM